MHQEKGLTTVDVDIKRNQYGYNILPQKPPTSDLTIMVRQFQSPLIYVLVFAAAASAFLKDITDTIVILIAVVINAVLGFYQERKAERGLAALRNILAPITRVVRDGKQQEIEVKQLVPGDLVVLTSGDRVPADGVLIEAAALTVNESILTGESIPVTKFQNSKLEASFDKSNQVFMGTIVVGGIGRFVVTGTGLRTEMGKIATSLSETAEEPTPLQIRFAALAKILTVVVIVCALLILGVGMLRGESWVAMFTTAVAVAVAAIPEGLVIALTAILALGMQRILKRKALVRKLVVAETLGTVTVIATDKTGTLTEGKLKVVKTHFMDKKEGILASALANHLLDPLEHAIWDWLKNEPGDDPEELQARHERIYMLPFDSARRFSATAYSHAVYVLGAPEVLIEKSKCTQKEKNKLQKLVDEWSLQGLRVLALAYKKETAGEVLNQLRKNRDVRSPQILGFIGFADPVRKGVKEALQVCQDAGIAVRVVTGDYRYTAEVVMKHLGIKINDPKSQILEGEELSQISVEDLAKRVKEIKLFARVSPDQKLKIVEAFKKAGEIVALLGDGVNDAPAIKRADIGLVVGEATDVAKETADLVLLDSNFATIVSAVEEGRGIFINIQKVMTYLLGDTFAEVTLILLGLIFNVPLPLTAAQILWINLVTDTFPTLALTMEPKEKNLLKQRPISPSLPILSRSIVGFMLVASFASGAIIFGLFVFLWRTTGNLEAARLVAFTAFSVKSLVYVFSLRDRYHQIWQTRLMSNRWLWLGVGISGLLLLIGLYVDVFQKLLSTRAPTGIEWMFVVGAATVIVVIIESVKAFRKLILVFK